jgi:20S proteasome subunit beta 7
LYDDDIDYTVEEYAHYLSKLSYDQRNKMNPYFNSTVLGGVDNGKSFVGYVDVYGDFIVKDCVIVDFGRHFCNPILANNWSPSLN